MTRTADEIKKGLECCYGDSDIRKCDQCPYASRYLGNDIFHVNTCDDNMESLGADALAYIQQLEAQNAELSGTIKQAEETIKAANQKVNDSIGKFDKHGDNLNATIAEFNNRIRQLEKSLSFARDLADGLKAATVKQEQELYVSEERNRKLQVDLEDMTTRYKIADDCAKKKGEMNEKLYAELTAVKAERDALLEYLTDSRYVHCSICKHNTGDGVLGCKRIRETHFACFEWRGVQKEDGNA